LTKAGASVLSYLSSLKLPDFGAWVASLTHASVAGRPEAAARHKSFILARLTVAAAVLVTAPSWMFFHGWPSYAQALIFLLAQAPLISIVILSRTGNLRHAQIMSILGWLALATAVDWVSPGIQMATFLLMTLALIEAALTFEPIIVAAIVGLAFGLLLTDIGVSMIGYLRPEEVAAATHIAWLIAPLLFYVAILSLGDIRAEHARLRKDRRNARDLRLLTGTIGDIVLHLDPTGGVRSIVGETYKTYDLSERDLMGRGLFQHVHVADRPAFLKLASDALATRAAANAIIRLRVGAIPSELDDFVEPVFNFFDARTCPVETEGDGDAAAPIICILRDVTAARRADEELAAARREAERLTAAKTRFLANVSHELRTPLNAIIGFSEMLVNDALVPPDLSKRREYAGIIRDSGQHLLAVVNSILDMSKIEFGSMELRHEQFSLRDLIDECCDMMRLRAEQAAVDISRSYADKVEDIVADRRACKQIFINLLSNAIKFTQPAGKVQMRLHQDGNSLVAAVSDNGIGISPADLSRLGDPFFQASSSLARSHEGTGLGLSVVRGLVGLHGGSITIESSSDGGTNVTVRIPLDCRERRLTDGLAKIETVFRNGASAPGQDIVHQDKTVKKIA
jgi:cell cycle sensor histidine kinase DivJ